MKLHLSTPWGILGCLALCGFVSVQTLTPVKYLQGGVANRVLTDNGTTAAWSTTVPTSAIPNLSISGDVTGTLSGSTVTKVQGIPWATESYSAGYVPMWDGVQHLMRPYLLPSSFPPSGSAGGDLSGNYPNPTVATVNGQTASSGNVLIGSGSSWLAKAISGDATLSSLGALTLATVNSGPGSYGAASKSLSATVNAKGLVTGLSEQNIAIGASQVTSGQLALARGGTGADLSATGGSGQILKQATLGGVVTVAALVASEIPTLDAAKIGSGVLDPARLASGTPASGKYPDGTGVWTALPTLTDLGGVPTSRTLTLSGTANQISVTGGAQSLGADRTWTIGTVQDIGTASSPTFVGATFSGLTASQFVKTTSGKALTTGTIGTSDLPTVPVSKGGTNLTSLGTANQLLGVDSGATGIEYKTISGTTNRVTVTHGAGTITLSGPQDLGTASSPTFAGATFSGLTASRIILTDGTRALTSAGYTISAPSASGALYYDDGTNIAKNVVANTRVVFMSSGVPTGSANFTWDNTNNTLSVGRSAITPISANYGLAVSGFIESRGVSGQGAIVATSDSFATSGNPLAIVNGGSVVSATAYTASRIQTVAAENHSATNLGSNLRFAVPKKTTTTLVNRLQITSEGNIITNDNQVAVGTSSTDGFLYVPNMAGAPSGTPTSYTGNTPLVYDTSNNALWVYDSGWKVVQGGWYEYTTGSTTSVTIPDGVTAFRIKALASNTVTVTLPAAAKYKGRTITMHKSGNGSGALVVVAGESYTTVGNYSWISDGTNWWSNQAGDTAL